MLAYHVSMYVPGPHLTCIIRAFAVDLSKESILRIDRCMTAILQNSSPQSRIIVWLIILMSKSQNTNQRWRRAFQKVRNLVRSFRSYEKPQGNCMPRAKTMFARKQGKHVTSDKLPAIPGVCETNSGTPRRAQPQRSKPLRYNNIQRKRIRSSRGPLIPEECEVRFEETLKAEPRKPEHRRVKIRKAKPQQYCQAKYGLKQEKRYPKFITHLTRLESLFAIWIDHGGSVVVVVLLGVLASSLAW